MINEGDQVGRCLSCSHLQHEACWESHGVCCSYQCEQATSRIADERGPADLTITADELAQAQPLPQAPVIRPAAMRPAPKEYQGPTKLSLIALAGFLFALLGIPLLGLPGLVAIALGAIAIGAINTRKGLTGIGFAMAAIIIGVLEIIGWAAAGCLIILNHQSVSIPAPITEPLAEQVNPDDLLSTPLPIRKAIRANVLVTARGAMQVSEGSGVVLETRNDLVYIITNRHVIDGASSNGIEVTYADGTKVPAQLRWQGNGEMDAAVLSCRHGGGSFDTAAIRVQPSLTVGEGVFAIGNPLGLGWSYSRGAISAIRRYSHEQDLLRMIQAQLPLNPGNSGGGLYDEAGALIGINTLTTAEGIGFALAISDLVPVLESQATLTLQKSHESLVDAESRQVEAPLSP
jgi:S1-C subfamily serine protease